MITAWEPTPEELRRLNAGGMVEIKNSRQRAPADSRWRRAATTGDAGMIARLLALFRRRRPAPLPPRPADVPKMSAATTARLRRFSNAWHG